MYGEYSKTNGGTLPTITKLDVDIAWLFQKSNQLEYPGGYFNSSYEITVIS